MELVRNFYSFTNLVKFKFILKIYYLLLLLILFSCQKKDKNYYEFIALNDVLLPKAQAGDWRYSRKEKFQTFEDFRKKKRIIPKVSGNIIPF
jgi:archaemetzincin